MLALEAVIELMMTVNVRRRSGLAAARHIFVAAPGGGSVGDEAMYEAFVGHCNPRPIVVSRFSTDLLVAPEEYGAISMRLEGLLYEGFFDRLRALRVLKKELRQGRSLSVIGADVMDGVYNARSAVRRFRTAAFAARLGVPAQILGFSWNEKPNPVAKRAMRALPKNVVLNARDPQSSRRLAKDGARNVIEVADLAFLTSQDDSLDNALSAWLDQQAERPIILVNMNPRLATRFPDQVDTYANLIMRLVDSGNSVCMLPHDSRDLGAGSEVDHMARLHQLLPPSSRVYFVEKVLLPSAVASLASRCVMAVSGRMHLVILSAVAGTPAVGLDYQDKFEGLYALIGLPNLRVERGELGERFIDSCFAALRNVADDRAILAGSIPQIIDLAKRNFGIAGLGDTVLAPRPIGDAEGISSG